jgi:hypothetical protein
VCIVERPRGLTASSVQEKPLGTRRLGPSLGRGRRGRFIQAGRCPVPPSSMLVSGGHAPPRPTGGHPHYTRKAHAARARAESPSRGLAAGERRPFPTARAVSWSLAHRSALRAAVGVSAHKPRGHGTLVPARVPIVDSRADGCKRESEKISLNPCQRRPRS